MAVYSEKDDSSLAAIRVHAAENVDTAVPAAPYSGPVEIIVEASAWGLMNQHAQEDLRYESGGIMLGEIFQFEGSMAIRVTTAVAAREAVNDIASIQFTYDTWRQMENERRDRASSEKLIGWYHTHPGFSAFLSDTDRFMHRSFFTQPWHVALVIDPVSGEHRFYHWDQGEIREVNAFLLQISNGLTPRAPLSATLAAAIHQAARQVEEQEEGSVVLVSALRKLVARLGSGLSGSELRDLLPFILACSELEPEALTAVRSEIEQDVTPDSPIDRPTLVTVTTNRYPEGAFAIAGGWLAQQFNSRQIYLRGLAERLPFSKEIELPMEIDDLTIDENGYMLALVRADQRLLFYLDPSLSQLSSSGRWMDKQAHSLKLPHVEVDWQEQRPSTPVGKILAARRTLYALTRSKLYVLSHKGLERPLRCALSDVQDASACGWPEFATLLSWTADQIGNLYILGGTEKPEVWCFERLAGRWRPVALDEELGQPKSIAAGMSALSVLHHSDAPCIAQYSLSNGRRLCTRPLGESLKRLGIHEVFVDANQRLYLLSDHHVFQAR